MGQQINFLMHPDDYKEFVEVTLKANNVIFMSQYSESRELNIFASLNEILVPITPFCPLCLCVARQEDLSQIHPIHVPTTGKWIIHTLSDPVIEFARSNFDGEKIGRGRIYFQPSYFNESGVLITKSKDFIALGRKLISWIRRHYKKNEDDFLYVGPHAALWLKQHA